MHIYLITRGIKHDVDRFVNDMQAQYFPYKIPEGEQKGDYLVQLAMRPIQLWEIVFPAPAYSEVVKTIWGDTDPNSNINLPIKALKKMLKAKKFPEVDPKALPRPLYRQNIGFQGIGIKEDNLHEETGHETL